MANRRGVPCEGPDLEASIWIGEAAEEERARRTAQEEQMREICEPTRGHGEANDQEAFNTARQVVAEHAGLTDEQRLVMAMDVYRDAAAHQNLPRMHASDNERDLCEAGDPRPLAGCDDDGWLKVTPEMVVVVEFSVDYESEVSSEELESFEAGEWIGLDSQIEMEDNVDTLSDTETIYTEWDNHSDLYTDEDESDAGSLFQEIFSGGSDGEA